MYESNLRDVPSGEAYGRVLLAVRTLPGRVCFFKTKAYLGLGRVERFELHPDHFEMQARVMRDLPPAGEPPRLSSRQVFLQGNIPFQVNGSSLTFVARTEVIDAFTTLSHGTGGGVLFHHPRAVAAIDQLRQSASSQAVIDAVNFGEGLSAEVLELAQIPFEPEGLVLPDRPSLQVSGDRGGRLLRLDGLPAPASPCLAWSLDDPLEVFIGACRSVMALARPAGPKPVRGRLMDHLVDCDRRHRLVTRSALPAVESTPELLYAHRPLFSSLYHFAIHGVSVNHELRKADLVRLMGDLARFMGWDFSGPGAAS